MAQKDNQKEMNDQLKVRREKMQFLKDEGIDPFGSRFERTHLAAALHEEFEAIEKDDLDVKNQEVTIAGRMMSKRGKGKVGFAISAIVQVRFKFMFVKTKSVKITTKFSRKPI